MIVYVRIFIAYKVDYGSISYEQSMSRAFQVIPSFQGVQKRVSSGKYRPQALLRQGSAPVLFFLRNP